MDLNPDAPHIVTPVTPDDVNSKLNAIEAAVEACRTADTQIIAALEATINSLKESNSSLKESNAILQDRIKDLWFWPKILFAAGTCALTLFFGVNLLQQYLNIAELSKRADELHKQTSSSQQISNEISNDIKAQRDSTSKKLAQVDESLARFVDSEARAHSVLSNLAIARDQLATRHNPTRARFYADRAISDLAQYDASRPFQNGNSAMSVLWTPALITESECHFQTNDIAALEKSAEKLIGKDSKCPEGYFYLGVSRLRRALSSNVNNANQEKIRSDAIANLEFATKDEQTTGIASLFLAAAYAEDRQFALCATQMSRFLSGFAESEAERERLPESIRAQIIIASAFQRMSQFIQKKIDLPGDFSTCAFGAGAIGSSESEVFEHVLTRMIERRSTLNLDENKANLLGIFCVHGILALARARPHGGGCEADDILLAQFELCPYKIPILSKNKKLGIDKDGKIKLYFVEIVKVPKDFGSKQTISTALRLEEVEIDPKDSIPERRYVPEGWMHEPATLAPAPTPAAAP